MFDISEITKGMPTMKDHVNTVVAAVLAGAMLQKAAVPAGQEESYLLEAFRHFRKTL